MSCLWVCGEQFSLPGLHGELAGGRVNIGSNPWNWTTDTAVRGEGGGESGMGKRVQSDVRVRTTSE